MTDKKASIALKVFSKESLLDQVKIWKKEGKKIVFTNGCFDLIHPGHVAYLHEAATLGDVLVVGLNNDSSVKKIKGEERPINNEFSRLQLLAAMFFIDAVVLFNEETPFELIELVKPDVLVKGGDYTIENIVGAAETIKRGGEVKVLDFLPGYSSTKIIEKIKKL
ncbi:rfaE bifunctional protein nucleotidyltransferase chain/domain [Pedobacter sp. UYP30]|uniref:D-glycero-beta-D-manno-heptose 1-phosphate adenylyltransferase n=1 Tax=Pedobacter sp. UYP30 TaxID=1756400 RepID=UPI00339AFBF9